MNRRYGSVEAGGTKFVCAVGSSPEDLHDELRFPTGTPKETLDRTIEYFANSQKRDGPLTALGVGCFGPVDLNPDSSSFGSITTSPKKVWRGTNVLFSLKRVFDLPVAFDTDVNAAALAEWRWGAAQGLDTFVYLTIGTGIGGGGMVRGKLLHGLIHPEMGHMAIPHDFERDPFAGNCSFHNDCFEGLAAGPALESRWGQRAETLPHDHEAWVLQSEYMAQALRNLICILSPQRIILGGGVMQQKQLFPLIRSRVSELLAGYVSAPQINQHMEEYIVPPALGNKAGVLGGIALAQSIVSG